MPIPKTETVQFHAEISRQHKERIRRLRDATGVTMRFMLEQWIDRAFAGLSQRKRRAKS